MARVGKIARLPQHLRTQLNQRLANGETGQVLVAWLNEQPETQEVLRTHFAGRPISERNLSEWRQGGYEEWLRHQEARASTRSFLAQAEELEEEVGNEPLTDRVAEMTALSLVRVLQEAETLEGPARCNRVLKVVHALQLLRRGDHAMSRLRMEVEHYEEQREAAALAEAKERAAKRASDRIETHRTMFPVWLEYRINLSNGTLTPEREASIRTFFEKHAAWLRECSVPDLSTPASPEDLGAPNPSASEEKVASRGKKRKNPSPAEGITPTPSAAEAGTPT